MYYFLLEKLVKIIKGIHIHINRCFAVCGTNTSYMNTSTIINGITNTESAGSPSRVRYVPAAKARRCTRRFNVAAALAGRPANRGARSSTASGSTPLSTTAAWNERRYVWIGAGLASTVITSPLLKENSVATARVAASTMASPEMARAVKRAAVLVISPTAVKSLNPPPPTLPQNSAPVEIPMPMSSHGPPDVR